MGWVLVRILLCCQKIGFPKSKSPVRHRPVELSSTLLTVSSTSDVTTTDSVINDVSMYCCAKIKMFLFFFLFSLTKRGSVQTSEMGKVMTLTGSKCLPNLSKTSILLAKLIATK